MFGTVDRAAPVAAALVAARDEIAALAGGVQQVHADLARRAGAVADAGDQLTADTTTLARRRRPVADDRPGRGGPVAAH